VQDWAISLQADNWLQVLNIIPGITLPPLTVAAPKPYFARRKISFYLAFFILKYRLYKDFFFGLCHSEGIAGHTDRQGLSLRSRAARPQVFQKKSSSPFSSAPIGQGCRRAYFFWKNLACLSAPANRGCLPKPKDTFSQIGAGSIEQGIIIPLKRMSKDYLLFPAFACFPLNFLMTGNAPLQPFLPARTWVRIPLIVFANRRQNGVTLHIFYRLFLSQTQGRGIENRHFKGGATPSFGTGCAVKKEQPDAGKGTNYSNITTRSFSRNRLRHCFVVSRKLMFGSAIFIFPRSFWCGFIHRQNSEKRAGCCGGLPESVRQTGGSPPAAEIKKNW
jgi:hypothetical protein